MLYIKGGRVLNGEIRIKCAKNSALPIIAACLLVDGIVKLYDCPDILDISTMLSLIEKLGASYRREGDELYIDSRGVNSFKVDEELSKELRSSIFILGALIGRLKKAEVSYPGGCDIGMRPIDIHLEGLRDLGIMIEENGGIIRADGSSMGGEVFFDYPSVGATENIMLAAVLGQGLTVIHNVAKEPEIVDLADFLNAMGARVVGAGSSVISIHGVAKLHEIEYTPIPDRIVAGTYMILGAMLSDTLVIHNVRSEHLTSLQLKLLKTTCQISVYGDTIIVRKGTPKAMDIVETMPYPAFPTDLQSQIMAFATICKGATVIRENVFETRYRQVEEFRKMGANIVVRDKTAIVKGVKRLCGASVFAHDLRGGAGLVLAGLAADGKTILHNERHIDRGYESIEKTLLSIGADIKRIE